MPDLTERAEKLAAALEESAALDYTSPLTRKGIAATLRALVEENRKLRVAALKAFAAQPLTPPPGGERTDG